MRLNLEGEEHMRVQREVDAAVSTELIRRNPFDLPGGADAAHARAGDRGGDGGARRSPTTCTSSSRSGTVRAWSSRCKREVLLDAVARQEKLEVGDEEVAGEIQRMAQADPRQAARVRARYQSAERREALRDTLRERKALDWLIEKAEIADEPAGTPPLIVPAGR